MNTLIFIVIMMICIAIVGFLFKNIYYIIATVVVVMLLKKTYAYVKKVYNKGKRTLDEKKYKRTLEDMKNNTGKVSYVDAEVVRTPQNESNEKDEANNSSNYIDVDYKDIE